MTRRAPLPMWLTVALWIVAGCLLPAVAGQIYSVRDLHAHLIHDEHGYLLQADTFASGRLTNPTPAHFEFFESPFVMLQPTYQAKYPPGQAVFLAIGQKYFGHPIYGVWLTCGLFAGALYWMLCGWITRTWAFVGTLQGVGVLGITSYWSQHYWGGMLAATGGALVLGGTCWTLRRWRPIYGFLTGLGAVMLAVSRPYEGTIVCLACAPVLAFWLWSGTWQIRLQKLVMWCVPFALVLASGITALATYNHAVTGRWSAMPYSVYHKQYFTCGLFRWQPLDQIPERRLRTRVREYFEGDIGRPGRPGGPRNGINPVLESALGALLHLPGQFMVHLKFLLRSKQPFSPRRILEYVLIAAIVISLIATLLATRRWGRVRAAHLLLVLSAVAGCVVWWKLLHYRAPFVCLYYFLAADLLRRLAFWCRRRSGTRKISMRRLSIGFSTALLLLIPMTWLVWGTDLAGPESDLLASVSQTQGLTRCQLMQRLARESVPVLAFVRYAADVSPDVEWVYNRANLDQQRVVLAHDMGEENSLLIEDFPKRDVWLVTVTTAGAEIRPASNPPAVPTTP